MSHPTSVAIRDADDDVVAHLEWCERCRDSIDVDVDLAAVRRRIVAEVAGTAAPQSGDSALNRPWRPWLVAAASAAAVLALFVPLALRQMNVGGPDDAQTDREAAELMFASEQGDLLPLATGAGWSVSIAQRGPGFCYHTNTFEGASTSDTCMLGSHMDVPEVMAFGVETIDGDVTFEWVEGTVVGVVADDVDRVEIRFDSGQVRDILPGSAVELGYRGFGTAFVVADVGLPVEIEAFSGTDSRGVGAVETVDSEFLLAVEEEPRVLTTGDGWSVLISRKGPGFCVIAGGAGGGASGCWEEAEDEDADLRLNVTGTSHEMDGGNVLFGSGLLFGVVLEGADRILVRFESGADEEALLGDTIEFGYRGFGLSFDGARTGPPVEVEAFSGTDSLAVETLDMYWRRGGG